MIDDLKRQQEIDAFYGESMDWPHAVGIIAAVLLIAYVVDRIERRVEQKMPPAEAQRMQHPLRGDHCDITITQRSAGPWSPERCAQGERK